MQHSRGESSRGQEDSSDGTGIGVRHADSPNIDIIRKRAKETEVPVRSPGGSIWRPSEQSKEMLTKRRDGSTRETGTITSGQLKKIWENPGIHIKGWRQVGASDEVEKKAKRATKEAERKQKKREEDPNWAKSEIARLEAWRCGKDKEDPEHLKNRSRENYKAFYGEKKEDPNWVAETRTTQAEAKRKKRRDPVWAKETDRREVERRRGKRARQVEMETDAEILEIPGVEILDGDNFA